MQNVFIAPITALNMFGIFCLCFMLFATLPQCRAIPIHNTHTTHNTQTQMDGNEDDDDERNEWADVDEINGNLCVLSK